MKKLKEYIHESLQNKYLQMLAKSIKGAPAEYYANKNATLADLTRLSIRWDKISPDFGTEFGPDDKNIAKLFKKIKNRESNSIILAYNEDKTLFRYILSKTSLKALSYQSYTTIMTSTQSYIKDVILKFGGVLLDFDLENSDKYMINSNDEDSLKYRMNKRDGEIIQGSYIFSGQTNGLLDIAQQNKTRYESILAQKHKNDFDDKGLGDKIGKTVNDVLSLVKNPTEKAKNDMYRVQGIMQMLYSQAMYDTKRHTSYGKTGLLPLYKIYIEYKGSLDKKQLDGRMDRFYYDNAKNAYDALLKMINDIENIVDSLR